MIAKDINGLNLYPGTICVDVTSVWSDEYRVIGSAGEYYTTCTRLCDNRIMNINKNVLKVKNAPYRSALLFGTCLDENFIKEWNNK